MNLNDKIKTVLTCQDGELNQITSISSIHKLNTYYISKLFKNYNDNEIIENWANNIISNLNKHEDIKNNCECDFRICNDGNEKWNTGNLYIWVK